jgi:serine/threonine protein kinase
MYQLLCGRCPFEPEWIDGGAYGGEGGWNLNAMYENIIAGNFTFLEAEWSPVSDGARSLVAAMLQVNPSKRPTSEAVLDHPWLTAQPPRTSIDHVSTNIAKFQSRFSSVSFDALASQRARHKVKDSFAPNGLAAQ